MDFKELMLMPVTIITKMIDSFVGILVSGFVDALIWLFHSALLKPLAQELVGSFMINENMLSTDSCEIIGLILNYCYQKMLIIGFAILMLIATWQLFKNFFSYFGETESEEGWKIGAKLILYGILVLNSKGICMLVVKLVTGIMEGIGNISVGMNEVAAGTGNFILDGISNVVSSKGEVFKNIMDEAGMNTTETWASGIGSTMKQAISRIFFVLENLEIPASVSVSKLIQFILIILIDVKLVKLAINMAEKYMNVVLMIIVSPIAFACGVSKKTNQIFTKWVSFFTSGVLYQLLQYFLIAMLYYVVNNTGDIDAFKLLLIVWSILSMANNAEDIVDELGFSSLGKSASGIGVMSNVVNSIPVVSMAKHIPVGWGGGYNDGASIDLENMTYPMGSGVSASIDLKGTSSPTKGGDGASIDL